MKYLLIAIIKIYWYLPKTTQRKCLFKESCSHHVYKVTYKGGLILGIKTLAKRIRQCRPGYSIFIVDGNNFMRLASGDIINENEIANNLLNK